MSRWPIRLLAVLAAFLSISAAGPALLAQDGPSGAAEPPLTLSDVLKPSFPAESADCGFMPEGRLVLDEFSDIEFSFFLGFSASIIILDGGPNIDSNEFLCNSYTEALKKAGVGGAISLDLRIISDIYLRVEGGASMFGTEGTIMDNIGRKYEVDPLAILHAAIGASYCYPIMLLGDSPDQATDLKGLQLVSRCVVGFRYITENDAKMTSDPTGRYAEGDKFSFWHANGGAMFKFTVGAEFRVDIFSAFVEIGAAFFEEPAAGTHPRDYSNSEVIISYPLTVGFSMKF